MRGTAETLVLMRELVRDSLRDSAMRETAIDITMSHAASTVIDQVRAIARWLRCHITIVNESAEVLVHPLRALCDIRESGYAAFDCDDTSMLATALLASLGFHCRLRAITPRPDGGFEHVFVEYEIGEVWRPLDITVWGSPIYEGPSLAMEI